MAGHDFLLDENMVSFAFRRKIAADVWLQIAKNCHRIVVSNELQTKYWDKLRLRRRQHNFEEMIALLARHINFLLHDTTKSRWVVPVTIDVRDRVVRHKNDWFLEDIAVALKGQFPDCEECLFVSTDRSTRTDFNHRKMRERGFKGARVEEGLSSANEPCPDA